MCRQYIPQPPEKISARLGPGMLPAQAHKESAAVVKDLSGRYLEELDGLHASQCFQQQGHDQKQEDLHVQEPETADSGWYRPMGCKVKPSRARGFVYCQQPL